MATRYDLEEARIARQRLIAQALRDSGNVGNERVTRSAGAYAVPISPFEALTKALSTAGGLYTDFKTDQASDSLTKQKAGDAADWMKNLQAAQAPSELQPVETTPQLQAPTGTGTPAQQGQAQQDIQRQIAGSITNQNNFAGAQAATAADDKNRLISQYLKGIDLGGVPAALGTAGATQELIPPKPQPFTLNEGDTRFDASGKVIGVGAPKTYKAPGEDRVLINVQDGKGGFITKERKDFKPGVDKLYEKPNAAQINLSTMSGSALQQAAERYRQTGQLPPGLSRSPAVAIKIMNEAAKNSDLLGDTAAAAATRQQMNKAAQAGLAQITKQKTMVGAFEKTALKSLAMARDYQKQVDETGVPFVNKWFNSGRKTVTGSGPYAAFTVANDTFLAEYAKIMSGSMGNTPASDAARAHANELLSKDMSPEGYQAALGVLEQEMHNRMTSFDEQIAELQPDLNAGADRNSPQTVNPPSNNSPQPVTPPPAATPKALPSTNAKGWVLHQDHEGNQAYVSPDGKQYEEAK